MSDPEMAEWMKEKYGSLTLEIHPKRGGPITYLWFDPDFGCDGWRVSESKNFGHSVIIPPIDSPEQMESWLQAWDVNALPVQESDNE